jgi:hypothetical protein
VKAVCEDENARRVAVRFLGKGVDAGNTISENAGNSMAGGNASRKRKLDTTVWPPLSTTFKKPNMVPDRPEDAGKHEEREHTKRILVINGCRVLTKISKTVDDAAHVETCGTKPKRVAADIFAAEKQRRELAEVRRRAAETTQLIYLETIKSDPAFCARCERQYDKKTNRDESCVGHSGKFGPHVIKKMLRWFVCRGFH